jgi:hypothetical protein
MPQLRDIPPMRSWISGQRLGWFRQGVSFGPEGFRGGSRRPVIVTEQQADPVELLYQGFRRLDAEQRRRLLRRIDGAAVALGTGVSR